jgi:hypothetical protein
MIDFEGRRISEPPLLVWATRKIVEWGREGLRRAGKPGLHIFSYPLLVRSDVILGVLGPDHIRPTDCISATHVPELYKFYYDNLIASQIGHDYGCFVKETNCGYPGGFCGGYEGAILENIASQILAQMICKPDYHTAYMFPVLDANLGNCQESLWAESLMLQAIARNSNIKNQGKQASAAEPGSEQSYLERAAASLTHISSGEAFTGPATRNIKPSRSNLGGPLEIKWGIELARAGIKLKREELNGFVKKIMELLPRENLINPPRGKSFNEAYDFTLKPKKEMVDLYNKMHSKIVDFGVPFDQK